MFCFPSDHLSPRPLRSYLSSKSLFRPKTYSVLLSVSPSSVSYFSFIILYPLGQDLIVPVNTPSLVRLANHNPAAPSPTAVPTSSAPLSNPSALDDHPGWCCRPHYQLPRYSLSTRTPTRLFVPTLQPVSESTHSSPRSQPVRPHYPFGRTSSLIYVLLFATSSFYHPLHRPLAHILQSLVSASNTPPLRFSDHPLLYLVVDLYPTRVSLSVRYTFFPYLLAPNITVT